MGDTEARSFEANQFHRISAIDTVGDARSGCYRGVVFVAFVTQNAVIEVGIPAGRYCRIGSLGDHVGEGPLLHTDCSDDVAGNPGQQIKINTSVLLENRTGVAGGKGEEV